MPSPLPPSLQLRLVNINLLLCDVDGVLTNGTVVIGDGTEYKQFNIQDGLGLHLLRREGIKVGWISNRPSSATQQRADELKIDFLCQKQGNKVEAAQAIMEQAQTQWDNVCYVGDDLVDLAVMKLAGAAIAVQNAIDEVKSAAHHVTEAPGGAGAVREVAQLILVAQQKWSRVVDSYLR